MIDEAAFPAFTLAAAVVAALLLAAWAVLAG